MRNAVTTIVLLLALAATAERQPYERYKSIVDRQMFGEPPPGFDPTKMPNEVQKTSAREEKALTQEQEQVKKAIRFSVLNVTAGVLSVGFTDNSDPKAPRHHYLKVGESSADGWLVKAADAEAATMTVEKDGVEVTLKLGGDSASAPATEANGPAALRRPGGSGLLGGGTSLRAKRQLQERQQQENAARLAEETRAREAREAEERQLRAEEREQQRAQLLSIQEELRKVREQREKERQSAESSGEE